MLTKGDNSVERTPIGGMAGPPPCGRAASLLPVDRTRHTWTRFADCDQLMGWLSAGSTPFHSSWLQGTPPVESDLLWDLYPHRTRVSTQ